MCQLNTHQYISQAIERGGDNYLILDSRAAVLTKLGRTKEALQDAKRTIDLAPEGWQGYARAARLFFITRRYDASLKMVSIAMGKLKTEDTQRRTSLLSLEADVRKAQDDLEKHRQRITDHMGKLPIELFGEIARLLVEKDHTASISLSQVSKHWRTVVHNIPYLWNVLVLTKRRPKQKAKLWIERSIGRIHKLSIRSSALDTPHWPVDPLRNLQWEYLRVLDVENWNPVPFLRSIGKSEVLTGLERVAFHNVHFPGGLEPDAGIYKLCKQDGLRHLTISLMIADIGDLVSRTGNLTSITLQSVGVLEGAVFDLLEANPTLESLTIETAGDLGTSRADLALKYLTQLQLKDCFLDPTPSISLPALRILRLDIILEPIHTFLLNLVASGCHHLNELTLRSCRFRADSLIDLLRHSPELQILEVSNVTGQCTAVIEALAESHSLSCSTSRPGDQTADIPLLCPNLTQINFSKCTDIQTGPLVRMIRSRLPVPDRSSNLETPRDVKRIDSLVIDGCPNVDSTWIAWFRENIRSVSCVYMTKKTKFRA
jgi:hypothetical protein